MSPNDLPAWDARAITSFVRCYLWPVMKSYQWRSGYAAFLAETEAFHRLESAGLPVVRCIEGAGADFLLATNSETVSENRPHCENGQYEVWRWATRMLGKVLYLEGDFKYIALKLANTPRQSFLKIYASSSCNLIRHDRGRIMAGTWEWCELIVLVFENEPNYQAWVPKIIYLRAQELTYGIEPLGALVPTWCLPFMIATGDLNEAGRHLIDTVTRGSSHPFVNPTTAVQVREWHPRPTGAPRLNPDDHEAFSKGHDAMQVLWAGLEAAGCKIHLNPVQPVVCDFILEVEGPDGRTFYLYIEYKGKYNFFFLGRRSPFLASRQYHLLFSHDAKGKRLLCIPRHKVKPEWRDAIQLKPSERAHFEYSGDGMYREVVKDIRERYAAQALAFAEQNLRSEYADVLDEERNQDTSSDDSATSDLSDSSGAANSDERSEDSGTRLFPTSFLSSNRATLPRMERVIAKGCVPLISDFALPWLCHWLNTQCMHAREMICFPLDPGHPYGSHVLCKFHWKDQHVTAFIHGKLPVQPYFREMQAADCIILRFMDFSGAHRTEEAPKSPACPIWMRRRHTIRLRSDQPFFVVGGLMTAEHTHSARIARSLVLLPSEFTTFHDQPLRSSNAGESSLERYVSMTRQPRNSSLMPYKALGSSATVPLQKGGEFLKPRIQPVRYIVDGSSIANASLYAHLRHFLESDTATSVQGVTGSHANTRFEPAAYRTTMHCVNQAGYDLGLFRYGEEAHYKLGKVLGIARNSIA